MGYLPEGYHQIQDSQAAHCASDPTRRNHRPQALQAHLLRSVKQEKIVAPIAQPERWQERQDVNPRQERQHNADLQAQDNVEDDRYSRRHFR
jgi:hypothetical protein